MRRAQKPESMRQREKRGDHTLAERIIIPRMGQTMTEGTVARWYVSDGAQVSAGDDIYELEYDKSSATIEAKTSGTVRLLCEEGDVISLGQAVAVILAEGEKLEDVNIAGEHQVANAATAGDAAPKTGAIPAAEPVAEQKPDVPAGPVLASPMARKMARDAGIDLSTVRPGKDGVIHAADIPTAGLVHECDECSRCGDVFATPMARKLAKEKGIDLADIASPGQRVRKADVLAYEEKKAAAATPVPEPAPVPAPVPEEGVRRVKMSAMGRVIAQNMSQSYFTYPTVTLNSSADMTELLRMRSQLNKKLENSGMKLTVTDILIKIVAMALRENPVINTTLDGNEVLFHEDINVGFATALDDGLVVPVVRHADRLSLTEIAAETRRLIGKARADGVLPPEEMQGGTFSITNLGAYGIDTFNPIINMPQSAILGIGRTVDTLVMRDGQIVSVPMISLSITHDHRVIHGVPAARFLQTVAGYIEAPYMLLLDGRN